MGGLNVLRIPYPVTSDPHSPVVNSHLPVLFFLDPPSPCQMARPTWEGNMAVNIFNHIYMSMSMFMYMSISPAPTAGATGQDQMPLQPVRKSARPGS